MGEGGWNPFPTMSSGYQHSIANNELNFWQWKCKNNTLPMQENCENAKDQCTKIIQSCPAVQDWELLPPGHDEDW